MDSIALRSYYLNTLGVPEFLRLQTKTLTVDAKKNKVQCMVVEIVNAQSFCKPGKSLNFLLKMLSAINLKENDIKCISIDAADDLNQLLKQYNVQTILLMGKAFSGLSVPYFSTHHPSVILNNQKLKREAWNVLKQLKKCLK